MWIETISYKGYDDTPYTEDFCFNISRAELAKMNYSVEGGMEGLLKRISQEKDNVKLYNLFENLIDHAYGRKSLDQKRFEKSPEILADFKQSEAYSEFIIKLLGDAKYAVKVIKAILPESNISEEELSKVTAELMPATSGVM